MIDKNLKLGQMVEVLGGHDGTFTKGVHYEITATQEEPHAAVKPSGFFFHYRVRNDKGDDELMEARFVRAIEEHEETQSAFDHQVAGSHYKDLGVQPLELTLRNRGYEAFSGACYTKIVKYMDRKKDNEVEQLKKAAHVLAMWIEQAEKEDAS